MSDVLGEHVSGNRPSPGTTNAIAAAERFLRLAGKRIGDGLG